MREILWARLLPAVKWPVAAVALVVGPGAVAALIVHHGGTPAASAPPPAAVAATPSSGAAVRAAGHGGAPTVQQGSMAGDTNQDPAATTVYTFSGSGDQISQPFSIRDFWRINYSYDCASATGGSGRLDVAVQTRSGGDAPLDTGVSQQGGGGTSDSFQPSGGTFVLSVRSNCTWTVNAVGLPG